MLVHQRVEPIIIPGKAGKGMNNTVIPCASLAPRSLLFGQVPAAKGLEVEALVADGVVFWG